MCNQGRVQAVQPRSRLGVSVLRQGCVQDFKATILKGADDLVVRNSSGMANVVFMHLCDTAKFVFGDPSGAALVVFRTSSVQLYCWQGLP